jgi:hypothetical protein
VIHRRLLLPLLVLALALAACSSGADGAMAPPSATPTPPAASGSAGPNLSEAPELEALLPDTIAGEETQKLSMKGDTLLAGGVVDTSFTDFLGRLGAEPSDVAVAFATAVNADSQAFAYQVAGTPPDALLREFQGSVAASDGGNDVTWETATVGGKDVQRGTSSSNEKKIYLLPHGDTIFVAVTSDAAIADEILAALP